MKPQPIQLTASGNFLYQLDAPIDEGGKNLWSGQLQQNNRYGPEAALKAAKLFAAAEDLLAALTKMVDEFGELPGLTHDERAVIYQARRAITKAEQD